MGRAERGGFCCAPFLGRGPSDKQIVGLLGRSPDKAEPVEFEVEARVEKDDFGRWRIRYNYDPSGPRWRIAEAELPLGH